MFLGKLQALLDGEDGFYEEIFEALRVAAPAGALGPDRQAPGMPAPIAEPSPKSPKKPAVIQLINAYRVRGHLIADLDPLGAEPAYHARTRPAHLRPDHLGSRPRISHRHPRQAFGERALSVATLREILETLRADLLRQDRLRVHEHPGAGGEALAAAAHGAGGQLTGRSTNEDAAAHPEDLMRRRRVRAFPASPLRRAEALLAGRRRDRDRDSGRACRTAPPSSNVHEIVIGMAHRGRLNILANIVGKPLGQIFSEFEGDIDPASHAGLGRREVSPGRERHSPLASGQRDCGFARRRIPSHLEAVNPVVEGIVRPKQDRLGDTERERVIPVLIHGDAAFAGQGVVAETLNLSQLDGYSHRRHHPPHHQQPDRLHHAARRFALDAVFDRRRAHGAGADLPCERRRSRSRRCASLQMAFDYRQQFKKDVVIDMICYRRHGHNEGDDPAYTQPIMYRKIKEHPSVAVQYAERLVREKLSRQHLRRRRSARKSPDRLNAAFDAEQSRRQVGSAAGAHARAPRIRPRRFRARCWSAWSMASRSCRLLPSPSEARWLREEAPRDAGEKRADRLGVRRSARVRQLGLEGTPVRLSGQDSGRGTFSQRHLRFYDYEDGHRYIPLQHMARKPGAASMFTTAR